ncbi:MAG: sigma-70 family RNA polymerase sigma factor [Symbiobacteriaceae bacterium]|nr:sigma-70 family RNA polymerase sigma factor [Symbiobacteriaceae bacterium]
MATLSEEDLRYIVQASQHDDMQAFELLVQVYEKKTYAMARSLVGSDSDAADVTQDIFVKLYLNIKSFNWESTFNTWFYRLVRNTAIDFLRRRSRRETVSLDAPSSHDENELYYDPPDPTLPTEEQAEKKELSELVARSIKSLPEEQRWILVMRDMMDASYEEIAAKLECPLGTVKSRLSRARSALKERIIAEREQYDGYLRLNE